MYKTVIFGTITLSTLCKFSSLNYHERASGHAIINLALLSTLLGIICTCEEWKDLYDRKKELEAREIEIKQREDALHK